MSQPPNREDPIVDALLNMAPEQRSAYLDQACAGDAPLRQLIEAILRAHGEGAVLLNRRVASPTQADTVPAPPLSEKPGDRIGRYKLLQQIGEGGCGVVYMADQSEPVRRRVALKVIKLGMDTKQVIARFEAERQALALMEHPNIAKVLDGGVTETGRPFFVMELVKGIPITRYCDEHRLDTAQRLELFILVCQAIEHAHQKGIVHRDIKPSNVLVADHDGLPVPKIIDFGIAKATAGQTLTDKTLFTALEQFMGTPAYMSPEQAQLSGLDIDSRSDVYSLGVLFYELLTGKTPFDSKRLVQAGFDEVRRIIREEDPPRPSTRLSTLDRKEQTELARQRQCDAPKFLGIIRGDLDWVVMKTLEKDRHRRYETAQALAADIRRFLRNEPVMARPPSKIYRFGKLVRRHKMVFGAATAGCAAFLVAGAVLVFGLSLAHREKSAGAPQDEPSLGGTTNLKARSFYLLGKADLFNNRDEGQLKDAVKQFTAATESDANFALAFVGLANACRQLDLGYEPGKGWDKRGFEAADTAIGLNPRLPEAYVFRGALFFTPFQEWNATRDVQDQWAALDLNSNVKNAHYNLAFVYSHLGLLAEALDEVRSELENDPEARGPVWINGFTEVAQGRYKEGFEDLNSIPEETFPHLRIAGDLKAIALFYCKKPKQAETLLDRFLGKKELAGDSLLISVQAIICAAAHRNAEAQTNIDIAAQGETRFVHSHHVAYHIGSAYALMGRESNAIPWLIKAAGDGYPCYPFLTNDPNLNSLRTNPAFRAFLETQRKVYEHNRATLVRPRKTER